MDPITQQTVLAAAGAGENKVYVDDVFSTTVYTGTGADQTITNGIDNTENALLWIKCRSDATNHFLADIREPWYYLTQTLNTATTAGRRNAGSSSIKSYS